MTPRITINLNKDGGLEIWLNPAGRDRLVHELEALDGRNDHFHLQPAELEGQQVTVQSIPYQNGDKLIEWGKVLFRPDEWDRKYFLHVLPAEPR